MAEKPVRIALSGYYGCGNTGDEAVLAGLVESFARRAGPAAAEFTVLSQNPADTQQRHSLKAVDRMSLSAVRATLRECDLLLSGGGSLLQDTTSVRSLAYYLWVIRMGLKARIPVMLYAQGIGPLRRSVSRWLTRMVVNRAAAITVRDPASAGLLRQIGVNKPDIEVTADPAFALTPAPQDRIRDIRERAAVEPGKKAVGVALRRWESASVPRLAAACDAIVESTGGQVVFIAMQPPEDIAISAEVAAAMTRGDSARVVQEPLSPREALGLVGSLDAMVAMRLHALVFAASCGVPIIALSYDPKVTQLMEGLGQCAFNFDLEAFDSERTAQSLCRSLEQDESSMARYRANAVKMSERALVNVDRALSLVR